MVHIYTFCDKTLIGRKNPSAKLLCEEIYKLNLKISDVCTFPQNLDLSQIDFKNKEIYFILLEKSSSCLNEYLSNLLGVELEENVIIKRQVSDYLLKNSIVVNDKNKSEWLVPKGAKEIINENGRVQGYHLKIAECEIYVLPNESFCLKQVMRSYVIRHLESTYGQEFKSETYKLFGLSEEIIYDLIKDKIKNKDDVYISLFGSGLDYNVVIKARVDNPKFESYRRELYEILQKFIYSVVDLSLCEHIQKLMLTQNLKVSIAGDLSASHVINMLSSISGNLNECFVFPNFTSIGSFIPNKHGDIDAEMVYEIAVKLLENRKTDISLVSFCFLEGEKRGFAYIAVGNRVKIDVYKHRCVGTNDELLENIASLSMFYLNKRLQLKDVKTI